MTFTRCVPLAVLVALVGCTDKGDSGTTVEYCPPVADAGPDESVELGDEVDLDASESGVAEGCEVHDYTFTWSLETTPAESELDSTAFSANDSAEAVESEFTPDVAGAYVIGVVVCDEVECSAPDMTVITVSAGDAAPIADAGDDQTAEVDERVHLDGTGSFDPDGDALGYTWTLAEVPSCSDLGADDVYDNGTAEASVIPDCEGTYLVSLVVDDGDQWSEPDYVTITVSSGDEAPIADAGESNATSPCDGAWISLDGAGSYDPEGEDLTYQWSLVSAPAKSAATDADFNDATAVDASFQWDVIGDYSFQLQVFDGTYWSAPDGVTVTVVDPEDNSRPVANAGSAQSLEVEAECSASEGYTITCEDCDAQEFLLDGSASYDPDGDNVTFSWTESTGELSIVSPATAVTSVVTPTMATDGATDYSWDVNLQVADCEYDDEDQVSISVSCVREE